MRTFLLASTAAILSSVLHGQQLYFGAIGGTALTRDFPLFESIYPGDRFGNPPSVFQHFSGPRSLVLGGLVGVRLSGRFSLEAHERYFKRYTTVVSVPDGSGAGSPYISQECPADSLRFAAIHFSIASCASFMRL